MANPDLASGQARRGPLAENSELPDDVLFGDVWQREMLAKRHRSLAEISTMIATGAFPARPRETLPAGAPWSL